MIEQKVKQVIIMRKDLNMRRGKQMAQAAHASMAVLLNELITHTNAENVRSIVLFDNDPMKLWIDGMFKKIVVSCDSEEELLKYHELAKTAKIRNALITDAGLTEFNNVPTNTCCAIGPGFEEDIDQITGHLKLM